MELFSIDDPEKERLRQRTLDIDAIRDKFSGYNHSTESDPLMEADRAAILRDLDESLSGLEETLDGK